MNVDRIDRTRIRLAKDAHAPAGARRALARMLDGDQRCDAVALATSELVTNVLLHADGAQAIDVQLSRRDDVVRVRVANAGVGFDVSPISHGEGPGGWGLEIVAAVSRTWGVEERAGETVVSFEI